MKTKAVLILLLLSFVNSSCLKKQDLHNDDLGPAIDPVAITKALGEGIGSFDYNEIKPNELNSIMMTQRIQDAPVPTNIEQQVMTVTKVQNTLDELDMDLLVSRDLYMNGTQQTRSWQKGIPKITMEGSTELASQSVETRGKDTVHAQDDASDPVLNFMFFLELAFASCQNSGKYPETCHNLVTKDIQYKVPVAAANVHGCADSSRCYIPAKKIEFDMIMKTVTDQDGNPRRIHHSIILSPHVPFLSRVLEYCSRSLYEITNANQKILADLCYTVNNYQPGSTTL